MARLERGFVWIGGALFVLSLAACAYAYTWTWSHPAEGGHRWYALAIDTTLFTAFALHHSLLARERVKQSVARLVPPQLVRSVYVWIASLLFIAVLVLWRPLAGDLYSLTGWRAAAPIAAQLFGLWTIIRAIRAIDGLALAGIRTSASPETLQVTGPYHWVRHPVYLGWVLLVFGSPHMNATRLAFAVISTAYLVAAVPWEERSLTRAFGVEYSRYQHAVRWRIVPYVY